MGDGDGQRGAQRPGLLDGDGMVVAPGAYDCVTAKLIELAWRAMPGNRISR